MAVPTFREAGAGNSIATTGVLTVAYPIAGLVAGDLFLLHVTVRNTSTTVTNPGGSWATLYGPDSNASTCRSYIFGLIAVGNETGNISVSFGSDAAVCKIGRCYRFRGTATSSYNESGGHTFSTTLRTVTPAAVTSSKNDDLAVAFVYVDNDTSVPGGFIGESGGDWTETTAEYTTTSGSDGLVQLQTAAMADQGTLSGGGTSLLATDGWGCRTFGLISSTPTQIVDIPYGKLFDSVLDPTVVISGGSTNVTVTPNALTIVSSALSPDRNAVVAVSLLPITSATVAPTSWAFPSTAVLDTFNRINEGPPPSSDWSNLAGKTGLKVLINQLAEDIGVAYEDTWGYWSASSFGPDTEAFITIADVAVDSYTWLWVRFDPVLSNGYGIQAVKGTSKLRIYRLDDGDRTQLGTDVSQAISSGDSIGISVIGSTISLYYKASGGNWVLKDTQTDSTYSGAGNIAIQCQELSSATKLDDLGGGTLASVGNVTVSPSRLSVASSAIAPTVNTGRTISTSVLSISSSTLAPVISTGTTIAPSIVTVVSATVAPATLLGTTSTPTVLALVSGVYAPTVNTSTTISPTVRTVVSSVIAPTVSAAQNVTVTTSLLSIVSSTLAPTIKLGATITPNALTLVSAVIAPSVQTSTTTSPSVLTVISSILAPSVTYGVTISPNVLNVVSSTLSPTSLYGVTISPSILSINSSVLATSISLGTTLTPSLLNIVSNIISPSLVLGATISPTILTIVSSALAASSGSSTNVTINPSRLSIASATIAPTALISTTITSSVLTISSSVVAPAINTSTTVSPSVLTVISSIVAPSVTAVQNVTITPSVLTISSSVFASTVNYGFTYLASIVTIASSTLSPTSSLGVTYAPSVLAIVSSILAPSVLSSTTISPSVLNIVSAVIAPSLSTGGSVTISVNRLSIVSAIITPSIYYGTTVLVNILSVSSATYAPTVSISNVVSPNLLSINCSTIVSSISLGSTVTPNVLNSNIKTLWNYVDECVLWFKMNDNAGSTSVFDYSLIASNGTAIQNTNLITTSGKVNEAFTFNGTSDYITAPVRSALSVAPGSLRTTVCAWVKTTATAPDDALGHRVYTHPRNNQGSTIFGIGMSDNKASAFWNNQFSVNTRLKGTTVINDGNWHFIAATWSGPTTTMKIYVDGQLENTVVTSVNSNTGSLIAERIGRDHTSTPASLWNGQIDNLMLFDTTLVDLDISALYRYGQGIELLSSVDTSCGNTNQPSVNNVVCGVYAPTINTSNSVTILPDVLSIVSSVINPLVLVSSIILVSKLDILSGVYAVSIVTDGSVTIGVNALNILVSALNPNVNTSSRVSPNVLNVVSSISSIVLSSGATVNPASLTIISNLFSSAISLGSTASLNTLALSLSLNTPIVKLDFVNSVNTLNITATVYNPLSGDLFSVTVQPSTLGLLAATLAPLVDAELLSIILRILRIKIASYIKVNNRLKRYADVANIKNSSEVISKIRITKYVKNRIMIVPYTNSRINIAGSDIK